MYTIGIDVGGMSIKFGLVNDKGEIVCRTRVKSASTFKQAVADIINGVNDLLRQKNLSPSDVKGIGIGCPGAVTSETGVVDFLPNLGWENVPLGPELEKVFGVKVKISNDANVAALAEAMYGCAKDYNSSIMFTLGTGVGGGMIIDRKLFEGGRSRGAELGHVTLFLDGKPCTCGRKGCVEAYASASALIEQTKEAMLQDKSSKMWEFVDNDIEKVDGRTSFECAKQGDETANKVVDTYVYYLSESILNMLNIFRPDAFILGGGISAQGDYLIDKIKKYCEKFDYGYKKAPRTEILVAKLGNDAGIIGAAALID